MTLEVDRSTIYAPITSYQTRLLQLAGANGDPEAPLVCDLHVADLLRPEFGSGLGLRAPPGRQDKIVTYDALSYTWGSSETSQALTCNGVGLSITANLNQALLGLRSFGEDTKYIWVDAICINQDNEHEKSIQVPNMFFIYQQASRVVAWLGGPIEHTIDVLQVAKSVDQMLRDKASSQRQNSPERQSKVDIVLVCQTLMELYGRPYFERIWIQQEIFAATQLVFICGQHEFTWAKLLADPSLLFDYYDLRRWESKWQERSEATKTTRQLSFSVWRPMSPSKDEVQIPLGTAHLLRSVTDLTEAHERRLGCFTAFSNRTGAQKSPELVDTLLYTGVLKATDPRDFVYGILPMSRFRHKQMSLQEWISAKEQQDITIPVDYSMDMAQLLAVTTWAVLMQGGLGLLAKFKVLVEDRSGWDSLCHGKSLPSWAIDWRLAARCFNKSAPASKLEQGDHDMHVQYNISEMNDAWSTWGMPSGRNILEPSPPPSLHAQFVDDNRNPRIRWNQLLVRGQEVHTYFLDGKEIYSMKGSASIMAWKLDFKTKPTDIIVDVFPFVGAGFDQKDSPKKCAHPKQKPDSPWVPERGPDAKPPPNLQRCGDHGGLWLLRRHHSGSTHWRLMAVLAYVKQEVPVFRQWKWTPQRYTREAGSEQLGFETPPVRRLRVEPVRSLVDYAAKRVFREYQEYIIV